MRYESRPLDPDWSLKSAGVRVFRAELIEDLLPGQSANCNPVIYDGQNWSAQTKITLKLYDSLGRCCALKKHGGGSPIADRPWAIWTPEMVSASGDPNRCEVAGEYGLSRRAKLTADLNAGGTATAHLFAGASDTGIQITVADWILSAGDVAINGTKCHVAYRPESRWWDFVSGQCSP